VATSLLRSTTEICNMSTVNIIIIVLAVVAVAVAAWALFQREKTRKLKNTFGPEYDRVIEQEKNSHRAEALLLERQKRVEKYHIRALTPDECDMYAAKWRTVQEHFVDDPRDAVAQADALVTEAMRLRGYPMSDFEQSAADLSVDHPAAVEEYRIAHAIATRDAQGPGSTEDLRKAMQHYRSLFEHVLDTRVLQHH
jgi:FtsZ-interacting cell division protein ZipA